MIGDPSFQVTARMQDGSVSLRVTAVTPYGNRSVSVSKDVDSPEILDRLEQLLQEAVSRNSVELEQQAFREAARALTAALDNEEDLHGDRSVVRLDENGEEYTVPVEEAKS